MEKKTTRYLQSRAKQAGKKEGRSSKSDDSDSDFEEEKDVKPWAIGDAMACLVNSEQFSDTHFLVGPGISHSGSFKSSSSSSRPVARPVVIEPLPEDPEKWTVSNVSQWITLQGAQTGKFQEYASVFETDGINGESLVNDFTQEEDLYMVDVKPHRRKLFRELQKLTQKGGKRKAESTTSEDSESAKRAKVTPSDEQHDENMQTDEDTSEEKVREDPVKKQESANIPKGSVLLASGPIERCHAIRGVLSVASPVFEQLINEHDASSNKGDIVVTDCSPTGFRALLAFVYTGQASVNEENLMDTMYAAQKYQIDGLVKECTVYIKDKLSVANVCKFFCESDTWLSASFMKFISVHADEVLSSPDFLRLSKDKVKNIIKSDKLSVSSEIQVFRSIQDWGEFQLKSKGSEASAEALKNEIKDLISLVRFTQIPPEELLEEVHDSGLLSTSELFSVVMYWHKGGDFEVSFNAEPRKRRYIELEYETDFDENGIIYWLGSQGGTRNWQNPQTSGDVRCTMSSTESGNQQNVTSRQTTQTYTRNQANQHIELDLGDGILLTPTYYTLRHGFTSANYYPRNWAFEGSDDGSNWDVIKQHNNDVAINSPQGCHSWEIDESEIECSGQPRYQRFRVRQTGTDHSGSNYLMVCGIEIYGRLYTKQNNSGEFGKKKDKKKKKKKKKKQKGGKGKSLFA